jgi:hypothetical protein
VKLREIAARIQAHLERFNASATTRARHLIAPSNRYVYVTYIEPVKEWRLGNDTALAYLEWLDAGNVGDPDTWERAAAFAALREARGL